MIGNNTIKINIVNNGNSNLKIDGDSNSPLNSKNESIFIGGNNNSTINGKNGYILVTGNNNGNIECKNGEVNISGNNNGIINGKNGGINIGGINILTINNQNASINVGGNKGTINTKIGSVNIGGIKIKVKKECSNITIPGTINGLSGSINNIITIEGDSNMSIIDGNIIINGLEQDRTFDNTEYKILIDNFIINYKNKTVSKNGDEFNILSIKNDSIRINGNSIEVEYKNQFIRIFENGVSIKGI